MKDREHMSAQQVVVIMVAATACVIAVGGGIVMAYATVHGLPVDDKLDKYATAALICALGLLAKLGDSRAEARDAARSLANDLTKLADTTPKEVTGPGGGPVATTEVRTPAPAPQPKPPVPPPAT